MGTFRCQKSNPWVVFTPKRHPKMIFNSKSIPRELPRAFAGTPCRRAGTPWGLGNTSQNEILGRVGYLWRSSLLLLSREVPRVAWVALVVHSCV